MGDEERRHGKSRHRGTSRRASLFDNLGADLQGELDSVLRRPRRFYRGEIVYHQHDPVGAVHLVTSGWFMSQIRTEGGNEVGLGVAGPGDVVGLTDAIAGTHMATLRALRNGTALALHLADFIRLRKNPEFERLLVKMLVDQFHAISSEFVALATMPIEARVARTLALLWENLTTRGESHIPLTQAELASLVHTARPAVSATLSSWTREGIVSTGRGSIRVLDLVALLRQSYGYDENYRRL